MREKARAGRGLFCARASVQVDVVMANRDLQCTPHEEPMRPPGSAPTATSTSTLHKSGTVDAQGRYLGVTAGPYVLALPIAGVRSILDVGGGAPLDVRSLGVLPVSLAGLLGVTSSVTSPGLVLLDGAQAGSSGPLLLSCCAVHGVFAGDDERPLPRTVACRWPGLVPGTVRHDGVLRLVLDVRVVLGLAEAAL
jgi:hypothetical protein